MVQRLKAILAVILFGMLLLGTSTYAIGNIRVLPWRTTTYTTDEWSQVWHYQIPKITVIKPASFDILFNGLGTSALTTATTKWYDVTINASYFGWYGDGTYFPAWVRYDNGFLITPQTIPQKDINLQVLVYANNWSLQFFDNNTHDLSSITQSTPWMYFNAWPWLVKQGKINSEIVRSRSHRQSKTYRTAILRKSDGSIYFLIATQKIDLPQFIVFAYKSAIVQKNDSFDLVNLDWGSSTAIRSPKLQFNAKKKLPLFIGIN